MNEILVLIVIIIYFLPTLLASKHRNVWSIALLNLFLGWTFIGWVVAMIWAVSKDKKESIIVTNQKSSLDELSQLKKLYDEGALTKEEFEEEKRHLLRK